MSATPAIADGLTLTPIARIHDNPFQRRLAYDDERIAAIAASIKEHGLLQAPVARAVDEGVELAFGHSRLRAFQLLAAEDPARWGSMPLVLRQLDDETMALHAWIENKDRKDLTAFEEAKAIERYTTQFGWSQAKAAEKLQLDRSTVANKLRLLRLPQQALEQLQAGALSERQAAALLPLMDLPESARAARLGYFYLGNTSIETVADLFAKAPGLDSATLRGAVDRILDNATVKLDKQPWATEAFEDTQVRAPICKECPLRLKSSNRCPDKACAAAKLLAHRAKRASAAAAAVGLPTTGYTGYSDRDTLGGINLEALKQIAAEKGCGRLAVVYDPEARYSDHPVEGHAHCAIVCGHGPSKRCGCKQTLVNRADPATGREAAKKAEQAKIAREVVPPAVRDLEQALRRPTPQLWRWIFYKIAWSKEGKLPKDAGLDAILGGLAAAIVGDAVEYSSEAKYAEQNVLSLFGKMGLPSPYESLVPDIAPLAIPDDAAAAVRTYLGEARAIAGIGMAHHFLGEARQAFDRAVSAGAAAATLEALAKEIDQVAGELAAADAGNAPAPVPSVGAQTLVDLTADTPILFGHLVAWADELERRWTAEGTSTADERTLELIAEHLEELADDHGIDDAEYEQFGARIDTMFDRLAGVGRA